MTHPRNTSATALWASAFVIAALVIVQAGRHPGNTAYAEMESSVGDYSILTAKTGKGPETRPYEALFVIDNREQVLIVYDLDDAQRGNMIVRGGGSLVNLFRNARPR
jgi:hypothetical protein